MDSFIVFGLEGALVVKYLVNAAKAMGMATKFALPLAIALGVLIAAAVQYAGMNATFAMWFKVAMTGAFAGLGAAEVRGERGAAEGAHDIHVAATHGGAHAL